MEDDPENLVTPCSLAMSLAPPRAPPHDSAHRRLMCGKDPSKAALMVHHHHYGNEYHYEDRSDDLKNYVQHGVKTRIHQLLHAIFQNRNNNTTLPHPHLLMSPEFGDQITRFIGAGLPLSKQNRWRDNGTFRSIGMLHTNIFSMLYCTVLYCTSIFIQVFVSCVYKYMKTSFLFCLHTYNLIQYNTIQYIIPYFNVLKIIGLADSMVKTSVPLMAISNPKLMKTFLSLSKQKIKIQYGKHPMQKIELFLPTHSSKNIINNNKYDDSNEQQPLPIRGFLFFVHGGAWGSGMPWMYRLTALPFLQLNMAVAIVGYRTYPDATVSGQVNDLEAAALLLSHRYSHLLTRSPLCPVNDWLGVSLMGHSSGAHIALLLLVEHIARKITFARGKSNQPTKGKNQTTITTTTTRPLFFKGIQRTESSIHFDSFIGLSGPYSISYHFDYEAGRGVEEISPMKPACGYSREAFQQHSPAIRLQRMLSDLNFNELVSISNYLPPILLVHGIEDDVVPFTATSDAAHVLRACGSNNCTEYYVPQTKHQEVIMHFMLGGKSKDKVIHWLKNLRNSTTNTPMTSKL